MSHLNPGRWLSEQLRLIIAAAPVDENYVEGVSLPMAPGPVESIEDSRLPRINIEKLEERKIFLSDRARSTTAGGRSPRRREVTLQLMLIEKLNSEFEGLEGLIELMYAIDELIAAQSQLGWLRSDNQPIYDLDALNQNHLFHSVLTCTFGNNH